MPTEPVAQETIGPVGGVLRTSAFLLTVPAGAFDAPHTLKLFVEQNSGPFADLGVSGVKVCGSISDIYVEQVSNGETTKKLLGFDCNTDSYVVISLFRE